MAKGIGYVGSDSLKTSISNENIIPSTEEIANKINELIAALQS